MRIVKVILSVLSLAIFLLGCDMVPASDVDFAKYVFTRMAKGSLGVEKYIGWESLKAVGVDVGGTYKKFNEKDKLGYRKAFLKNYSFSFRTAGGSLKYFHNWRIHSQDSAKTTIAVSTQNLTLLLDISNDSRNKRKLIGMDWLKKDN